MCKRVITTDFYCRVFLLKVFGDLRWFLGSTGKYGSDAGFIFVWTESLGLKECAVEENGRIGCVREIAFGL